MSFSQKNQHACPVVTGSFPFLKWIKGAKLLVEILRMLTLSVLGPACCLSNQRLEGTILQPKTTLPTGKWIIAGNTHLGCFLFGVEVVELSPFQGEDDFRGSYGRVDWLSSHVSSDWWSCRIPPWCHCKIRILTCHISFWMISRCLRLWYFTGMIIY